MNSPKLLKGRLRHLIEHGDSKGFGLGGYGYVFSEGSGSGYGSGYGDGNGYGYTSDEELKGLWELNVKVS